MKLTACHFPRCRTARTYPHRPWCDVHWALIPGDLRQALMVAYEPWQEEEGATNGAYAALAVRAVRAIKEKKCGS